MRCKYMYVLSTKKLIAESCDVEYYCSQSQCRQQSVQAYTMEDHAQLSVQFRNKFTCIKSEKSFRIHIPMYITTVRLVWWRENAWAISVKLMVLQVHLHCQMVVVFVLLLAYATDLWSTTATLTSGCLWLWHVAMETIRLVRDGEPRTATSIFTQLPS